MPGVYFQGRTAQTVLFKNLGCVPGIGSRGAESILAILGGSRLSKNHIMTLPAFSAGVFLTCRQTHQTASNTPAIPITKSNRWNNVLRVSLLSHSSPSFCPA